MPFVSRWQSWPSLADLTAIEGVKIIDLVPPARITGVGTGVVAVVGQFLKCGVRTTSGATSNVNTPTEIFSAQELLDTFGGWSPYSNPGGALPAPGNPGALPLDGNGFLAVRGKRFARLVVVNVEQTVGTCTLTVSGTAADLIIPPGIRVADADESNIFATIEEVRVTASDFNAGVATIPGVKMRRLVGSAVAPLADHVLAPEATGAIQGYTLDVTNFSSIEDITESEMDTNYITALQTLLSDSAPSNEVNIVFAARHRDNIVTATGGLKDHVREASSKGRGRIAVVSPPLGTSKATAKGDAAPGVGSYGRSDRVIYCYPGVQVFVPELPQAYISRDSDGRITWTSDATMASVLSQTPPERNPAEPNDYMSYVLGIETAVGALVRQDYEDFRRKGICAPRIDPATGPQFQSGVTSVDPAAYPNLRQIYRRRMADFIQDSLAARLGAFNKTLNTPAKRAAIRGEIEAFLADLKSENNPEAQRIAAYRVDAESGNTQSLLAQGIVVFIVEVQLLPTMDFIVLQANIGEFVEIKEAA